MAEKIVMPKAGMAMESGVIVRWLKNVGDNVSYGEPLLEIETDKTTMQVESLGSGYLLKILYDAGDVVPVVSTIGYLGEKDEKIPDDVQLAPQEKGDAPQSTTHSIEMAADIPGIKVAGNAIPATPLARKLARDSSISLDTLYSGFPIRAKDVRSSVATSMTPLAKRLVKASGLDVSGIKGSGHGGKIFSRDLPSSQKSSSSVGVGILENCDDTVVAHTAMRRTIARRMLQSHQEIPPVTLNTEANVTRLAAVRESINGAAGAKISFNDLVIKACAIALTEYPSINASYTSDGVIRKKEVNIGMAVALDDGLIVPVIKRADTLSLRSISEEAKNLAAKARGNDLSPDEYAGGTFTISNLGMFGITSFTPIINIPEACILGVCAIVERLGLAEDGSPVIEKFMGLSLTFDHRCVDGAGGARFLQRVVGLLQNPFEIII